MRNTCSASVFTVLIGWVWSLIVSRYMRVFLLRPTCLKTEACIDHREVHAARSAQAVVLLGVLLNTTNVHVFLRVPLFGI